MARKKPTTSATGRPGGIRWDVVGGDIRRLLRVIRGDPTAILLIAANVYPVIELAIRGEPIASIMVVYWMQMLVIGFWYSMRLAVIARWKAVFLVPMFLLMYLSIVNIFGIMVGGMLDDSLRGTEWHDSFSLWNYAMPAAVFFLTHGVSFFVNFIRGREFEDASWEDQMGRPLLRAVPMWLATMAGAFVGALVGTWAVVVFFTLPVKLALDVLGHLISHGRLSFDDGDPVATS